MAYLDLMEEDPNRNRRNGLIVFVICVIFIAITVKCAGQSCVTRTSIVDGYGQINRIQACKSLTYGVFCPKPDGTVVEDTIFVGVFADSEGKNYDITIYIVEPRTITETKTASLEIQLENNKIEKFLPTVLRSNLTSVYSEYNVTHEQYLRMKSMKYKKINFITNGQDCSFVCYNGLYFSEFFKHLK